MDGCFWIYQNSNSKAKEFQSFSSRAKLAKVTKRQNVGARNKGVEVGGLLCPDFGKKKALVVSTLGLNFPLNM